MKIKEKIALLCTLLTMTAMTTSAAGVINNPVEVDNPVVNPGTGNPTYSKTVTISGQIEYLDNNSENAKEITIQIHNSDTGTMLTYPSTGVYAGQTIAESNGSFSITFDNTQPTGTLPTGTYYITVSSNKETLTKEWAYISPKDIADMRAAILAAYTLGVGESESDIPAKLKTAIDYCITNSLLPADFGVWDDITNTSAPDYDENIVKFVSGYLAKQTLAADFTADDLKNHINIGYEISKLNALTKGTNTAETLLADPDYIAAMTIASAMVTCIDNSTDKVDIYTALNSIDLSTAASVADVKKAVYNTAVFTSFNGIMWQEAKGIAEYYNTAAGLGIDFTAYNALTPAERQEKAMIKFADDIKALTDTSGIKGKFDGAVTYAAGLTIGGTIIQSGSTNTRPSSKPSGVISQFPASEPVNTNPNTDTEVKNQFNDLDSVSWAAASINKLASQQIVSGDGDGKFRPQSNVTREEFVKMAINSLGLDNVTNSVSFTDVDVNEWYYPYICGGVYYKFIDGKDNGSFGVGESIKRADVAVIITRILKMYGKEYTQKDIVFKDVLKDEISYAYDAIYNVAEAKLMTGTTDVTFEPHRGITRAETAVVIDRLMTLLENN